MKTPSEFSSSASEFHAEPQLFPAADDRSLEAVAADINLAHRAATELSQSAIQAAYEAGCLLLEAKARVGGHGQWLPWLKTNCPSVAERTAQQYMRLSRNREAIEAKSAGYADLTINGALQLIPAVVPPIPERYSGWYDPDADRVWNKTSQIKAFRDAVMLPDIMDKLTTDQIAPLAQAVFDDLAQLEALGRDEVFTPAAITLAVKRRYREAFEKTAEQKRLERQLEEPHNKLVRELREGEAAMRKATHTLNHIDDLKRKHPDLVHANTGIMAGKFNQARRDMEATLARPIEKDITPQTNEIVGESNLDFPLSPVEIEDLRQEHLERERFEANRAAFHQNLSQLLQGASIVRNPADCKDPAKWKGTWDAFHSRYGISDHETRERLADLQARIPFLLRVIDAMQNRETAP